MGFRPHNGFVGDFTPGDGAIDFYLRVRALLPSSGATIVDYGAGRGAWFESDICDARKSVRDLRGVGRTVVAVDIDAAVMKNEACDERYLLTDCPVRLAPESVDLIVADYVLEHVASVEAFSDFVHKYLKPGGWICARTPHKWSYIGLLARLVDNSIHSKFIARAQPDRKEIDVFPTAYKLNTRRDLVKAFPNWSDRSFVFKTRPAYYFGNRLVYYFLSVVHTLLPSVLVGNLFVFVQKPHITSAHDAASG